MSSQFGKICSLILLEHFGEIVQKVGTDLFKWGPKPLMLIASSTELPVDKVKESLCVLIQYGLVRFSPGRSAHSAEYTLLPEKVFLLLRYPRYLYFVKTNFGVEAEMLLEELLRQGFDTASQIIVRATLRLQERGQEPENPNSSLSSLREKFVSLVNKQFLMRYPSPSGTQEDNNKKPAVPTLTVTEEDMFLPPTLNLKTLASIQQGGSDDPGDRNIYWKVNFDRFHQEFRDQKVIAAVTRRIDENAGEIMRVLIQFMNNNVKAWDPTSFPISFTQVKDKLRKLNSPSSLLAYLDQYLKVMEEDSSRVITRVDDSSGGLYTVNMRNIFQELMWSCVENIIVERFGSKAARIFRLVRARKFIEQEQIQQVAMIPAKEAKLLTYRLLQENFLQIQELRKSFGNSSGPNKTFFLFHIDFDQVTRKVLDMSYKALYNAVTRREHESSENRRLIDKKQRLDSIALNMQENGAAQEEIQEIVDMITPPEKDLLEKVKKRIKKLSEAELQLEENVFLIQLYLSYVD